jgi:putative two-component system response regulator
VFDALTRDRVYRRRLPHQEALRLMRDGRGTAFDPVVLDALLGVGSGLDDAVVPA